ncbi:phage virion morphogenesis protein [Mucilaginibacter sp. RCC_168]|uniref:phage virion morphogenesis protein n=1 Tax=Mucilaginibacter sp. RCC_168 TaxID=3239221 RepID=UPI0035239C28
MSAGQITNIFATIRAKLTRTLDELPLIVGNAAVNYSLDAFAKQAWEGKQWDKRKSKKDTGRSLLVKSGRGKRSIRIIRTAPGLVVVGSDIPYMKVHNEGGKISRAARSETFVRNRFSRGDKKGKFKRGTTSGQGLSFKAYSFNMPQRTFLKGTPLFIAAMKRVIRAELQKALKY